MTAPAITTQWRNLLDPEGQEWHTDAWERVFDRLCQPQPFVGDDKHGGWSPARFEPCRRAAENVRAVYALALDFDHGETIEGVVERFRGLYGCLHTSRKHTPEAHRFRVVLPLSRPVSVFEYQALWLRFAPMAGHIDPAPKDPSRFWFLPGVRDGGEFRSALLEGRPLDVDEWLTKPDPTTARKVPEPTRTRSQEAVEENARRYIAAMPEAISGSGGHGATWSVAVALARGFALSEDATFRLLWNEYNPRCQPAWTERALRHKAKQAQSARVPLGYLLDEERPEWRPSRPRPEMPPPDYWDDGRDEGPTWEPPSGVHAIAREPGDDPVEPVQKTAAEKWGASSIKAMLTEVFIDANNPRRVRGMTTGIKALDDSIGGYREGNVVLLGAQTSWGKSSFGVMALDENHKAGRRVLVVSCEDKRLLYGRRLACRMGGISALRMRDGQLRPEELGTLGHLADSATEDPVFLDAVGMPVEQAALAVRELCREQQFELVIVDYLQRFRSKRSLDRRAEVTLVCSLFSDEIKRANAAGLIISQVKRTEGKPPGLDDLKESGDLENMAEHVILGWREMDGERVRRKIGVRKNKDGPVDDDWRELRFDDRTASFTGATEDIHDGFDDGLPLSREAVRGAEIYDRRYP